MVDLSLIHPHAKDLGGGFMVRRLLPSAQQQAVGPFLFFDHFGPITATPADNHDVRPHPHIGLATVTYLYEGAMMHRDSLGVVQRIEPGAINLMVAGRGIVHSERTPDDLRRVDHAVHGLQLWLALPADAEERPPTFEHTAADAIPSVVEGGATVRVLMGSAFGAASPVSTVSNTLYLDIALAPGALLELPADVPERALYAVDGGFMLDDRPLPPYTMVPLAAGLRPRLSATGPARVALVGGEPLGPRHIWWNFVSSRKQRIVQAADDWAAGRFDKVPGDDEFIPLPAKRPSA